MKVALSLLTAILLASATAMPSWCANTVTPSQDSIDQQQISQNSTACNTKVRDWKTASGQIPRQILGAALGTIVGTPIALVRCTKRELIKQTKEAYTLGGVPKPLGYITAATFGVPSGILCGAWYGASDGAIDGLVNSRNTVFNKGTFSLDRLKF